MKRNPFTALCIALAYVIRCADGDVTHGRP